MLQLRPVQSIIIIIILIIIKATRRHTAEPGPTLTVGDTEADRWVTVSAGFVQGRALLRTKE